MNQLRHSAAVRRFGPAAACSRRTIHLALACALLAAVACLAWVKLPVAEAADSCPNASMRALQGSTYLADCRAYELVSPARKFNGRVGGINTPLSGMVQVGDDGARVAYDSFYPLDGSNGGSWSGFRADRDSAGWTNVSLLPVPGVNQVGLGFPGTDALLLGSTPDARVSVYFDHTTEPYGSLWVYRADGSRVRIADASVAAFTPDAIALAGGLSGQPWFGGIAADGSTVVFASTDALVPGLAETGHEILYVWRDDGSNGGDGSLDVVNRTSSDTLTLVDAGAAATLGGARQHHSVANPMSEGGMRNAISADGSRIFFQTPPPTASGNNPFRLGQGGGPLYVRDGTATVEVSAPAASHVPASPPTRIQYMDASVDGRYVFFWADGDLTGDAPTAGGIYRYDADQSALSFLATAAPIGFDAFLPTGMASEDGSRFYYQDNQTVRLHEAGVSVVVFAGRITSGSDSALQDDRCVSASMSGGDGRFFAFRGTAGPTHQVFRYDAATGALDQVSTGIQLRPNGVSDYPGAGFHGTCTGFERRDRARFVSDDGAVFFDTWVPLVAGDNNRLADAYVWRDGELSLLSSGTYGNNSYVVGIDRSGRDAFISTPEPLVYSDPDVNEDIYDVRVDGGIAAQNDRPAPPCRGDGCQGAVSGRPEGFVPGSASHGRADVGVRRARASRCGRLAARARGRSRLARRARARGQVRRARVLRKRSRALSRRARACRRRAAR